jgi:hypothetical protein
VFSFFKKEREKIATFVISLVFPCGLTLRRQEAGVKSLVLDLFCQCGQIGQSPGVHFLIYKIKPLKKKKEELSSTVCKGFAFFG